MARHEPGRLPVSIHTKVSVRLVQKEVRRLQRADRVYGLVEGTERELKRQRAAFWSPITLPDNNWNPNWLQTAAKIVFAKRIAPINTSIFITVRYSSCKQKEKGFTLHIALTLRNFKWLQLDCRRCGKRFAW